MSVFTDNSKKQNSCEAIRLDNISKTYKTGSLEVSVLKGISFSVQKGEYIGIMGSSGSGKSTLLNIIGLLDTPTSGIYYLNERKVEHFTDKILSELRNKYIGFIFQSYNLLPHLNVQQNIELPLVYAGKPKRERTKISAYLAERVGLAHRLHHRPGELSGGECQRVSIARALSNNPMFILADEPTGNLDEKTGEEILEIFEELHKNGITIIMVTHNPEYRSIFDKVLLLHDGRVSGMSSKSHL